MSNDTDFNLEFICPTKEQLDHVISYINFKKERWDFWNETGGDSRSLRNRIGAKSGAAFVAWGFDLEDEINVGESGEATICATAWANQNNLGNVWISGEDGEIADLRNRFKFLRVEGSYKDEFGNHWCV